MLFLNAVSDMSSKYLKMLTMLVYDFARALRALPLNQTVKIFTKQSRESPSPALLKYLSKAALK